MLSLEQLHRLQHYSLILVAVSDQPAMEMEGQNLHVVFLPYFSTSHMIPLVNTARLFATRGVAVTIITTPHNALLFPPSIDRNNQISVRKLEFPSTEVGLPEGIESFATITSMEMASKVGQAIALLQKPMEQLIRQLNPDCIFSDMFFPWTVDVADELKIPRILFYPSCFFFHSVAHNLKLYAPHEKVQSDTESFLIPGLPDKIEMTRSQLPEHVKTRTNYGDLINIIKSSELRSYGIVHDTFYEIEPAYVEYYKKVRESKFWHIGPVFLFSNGDMAAHPEDFAGKKHSCLNWLDSHGSGTVLYVCFGSMVRFTDAQLMQIALGLESSNHKFVWAVRKKEKTEETEEENWLPEGFEERIVESNKGVIIRGWAPQMQILSHPAIGGFMTHCGWNSTMEAVNSGVPLITWPLFAEQFYNEKLIQLLGIGVGVGSEAWNSSFEIKGTVVGREKIEKAIKRLMGDSSEADLIKKKVKELSRLAKTAVEERGSSSANLTALIDELKGCAFAKLNTKSAV